MSSNPESMPPPDHTKPDARDVRFRPRLSKTVFNFWLDSTLLVMFVTLLWISAVLQFVFPATPDASGWTLWGRDIVGWRDAQFVVLCVFAAGIVLHVMLHWSWVIGVLNQRIFKRTVVPTNGVDTLVGVGLLAGILHLLAAGLLVARYCVAPP